MDYIVHQACLSMGFSRQEYWSGLPYPPPGGLPGPVMESESLASPTLAARFLPLCHLESSLLVVGGTESWLHFFAPFHSGNILSIPSQGLSFPVSTHYQYLPLKHSSCIRWVTGLAMFFHLWTQWCLCKQSLFRGTVTQGPCDMVCRPHHIIESLAVSPDDGTDRREQGHLCAWDVSLDEWHGHMSTPKNWCSYHNRLC